MKERYIVEHDLSNLVRHSAPNCNTVEDLSRYLDFDPHPDYHLVSVICNNNVYTLIWELTEIHCISER